MNILYEIFGHNPLYYVVANDIVFGIAVLYLVRDNKKKMDALYERYDKDYKKRWGSILDETDIIDKSDRK